MCIVCTVVSVVSVAILVGIWTFQFLKPAKTPVALWDRYRLPDTLLPEAYYITLWPRLKPDHRGIYIFTGNSSVVFKCVKDIDLILIHSNKLNLTSAGGHMARLTTLNNIPEPAIKSTWFKVPTQYLVIELQSKLKAGESYRLNTEFVGELADDLAGFYRSEYIQDGVNKVVATSQMHPTHARKTFPCFDEPAMKAVFHITVLHERGTVALSNGQEIGQQWQKAVSEGHCAYALNLTGPILNFFENYYNVPYPLSKSDQIGLPDFYFGAMENWGLVTYREANLFYDPAISSNGNKEQTATIIAHELAHMVITDSLPLLIFIQLN
uniref:Alanyl aminopeptidase, membrane n=1 Tax=Astyanax mexicanus TaxID=7994 RepID=A0A3B1JMU0_ASTMX